MKWLAITLVGAVLVSVWAATIPLERTQLEDARDQLVRASSRVHAEILIAEAALRERARADSLLPLLTDTIGTAVVIPGDVEAAARDSIEAAVAREMEGIGTPRVRLGVFLIDARYGARSGYGGSNEREVYMGSDAAGPYCAVVETTTRRGSEVRTNAFDLVPDRSALRREVGAGVLGACAFVAQYGLPGPVIDAWLRAGGHRFARLRGGAVTRPAPVRAQRNWPFQLVSHETLQLRACRAERLDACRELVLGATPRLHAGPAAFDVRSWWARETPTLLADLEEEFGAERFARFWNATGSDVEEAFAEAFGTGLAEWTVEWSRRAQGGLSLAARMDATTVLLALLTASAFAAIAATVASRRQA